MTQLLLTSKTFVLALAAIIFGILGGITSAHAQSFTVRQGQSQTLTYTSSFGTAGAATATFSLNNDVLTVTYKNTSTANTYLNGLGFNSSPHILPENLENSTATRGWTADAGPGGGLGNFDLMAFGTGRNRLAPGASGTAVFILTAVRSEIRIEQSIVHLTSLPNGSSEKPIGVPDILPPPPPPGDVNPPPPPPPGDITPPPPTGDVNPPPPTN